MKTMKNFHEDFTKVETFISNDRKPDFNNMLKVLHKEKPSRPTLFEFIMCDEIIKLLTCNLEYNPQDPYSRFKHHVDAYRIAGYDFAAIRGTSFVFKTNRHKREGMSSVSLNDDSFIFDRESFDKYQWNEPEDADYTWLDELSGYLPEGMKLMVPGPDGVFETVLALVGYDNLCYMLADDPELVGNIFDAVGSRYLRYYELCSKYESVGFFMADDDWGFNTQPFLSVGDMRKYVIPWHVKIAEAAHKAGKPIVMHSCGQVESLMDDIIYKIKYDGKHSFEDNIMPVEEVYEKYQGKIAILGGIDIDYLCRSTPEQVYNRACSMLERSGKRGGYALGSGNSIPDFIPVPNYLAMIAAAVMNEH